MTTGGISIIIPVYNGEKYIERCLSSLIEKFDDDEILLVNDGSTDNSEKICECFRNANKNIIIINQRNYGVSAARNAGIKAASKEWIMFVDADDYLISGWRYAVSEAIQAENDADVIIFASDLQEGVQQRDKCIKSALGYESELGTSLGFPVSKLYRRELIIGGDISFSRELINGEDMIFNSHVFAESRKNVGISKSIYAYYKNMESATNRFNSKIIQTEHIFHAELIKLFAKFNLLGEEWNNLYEESLLNGLYAVAYRIALSNDVENKRILEELVFEDEYRNALFHLTNHKENISKMKMVILKTLAHEKVGAAIVFTRIICMVKIIYYKWRKEGIVRYI